MTHGGKRTGAGRPKGSGKYGTSTKAVRLPIPLADQILELLNTPCEPGHLQVTEIIRRTRQELPLYQNSVAVGFPSPAAQSQILGDRSQISVRFHTAESSASSMKQGRSVK